MDELAAGKMSIDPAEMGRMLRMALSDPVPQVRLRAVFAIAGRAGAARFDGRSEIANRWRAEHAVLQQLQPDLWRSFDDPDPRVRRASVIGTVNLSYRLGGPKVGVPLDRSTLQKLSDLYAKEATAEVRMEIVKTLALTSAVSPEREQLIVDALRDPSPAVVTYAAMGAGELRLRGALGDVALLLRRSEGSVRISAAQSLARYGAAASPYLPALYGALQVEPDPAVVQRMRAAIRVIESAPE